MNRTAMEQAGAWGGVVGALAFLMGSSTPASIGLASLGFLVGSGIGYWLAVRTPVPRLEVTGTASSIGRLVNLAILWAFVVWGAIGLIRIGWDVRLTVSTAFFAVAAIVVTYRHVHHR